MYEIAELNDNEDKLAEAIDQYINNAWGIKLSK